MGELTWSNGQQSFIDAAISGANIFLTGKAGTGKTLATHEAIRRLRADGRKVIAVAPTGVAANNINGATVHSTFAITPHGIAEYETCKFLKQEKCRMLKSVDTIVIDEISMLRPDVLDAIHWTLIKNGISGGLKRKQVIFIGDLKQLPSPIKDNERSVLFRTYNGEEFYHAKVYNDLRVTHIELDEVLRQSNPDFINALNVVREGGKHEYFRQFVHTEPNGIILAPHNATVDEYNAKGLATINQPTITFTAKVEGNVKAEDFNLPTIINVKNGAKIMYLVNSIGGELVNGSLGIFIHHEGCYYIRFGNVDHAINEVEFSKKEYVLNDAKDDLELRELGSIRQMPIKLAYALSIHKSQGLTFDNVTVDLTRTCFAKGQLYVALSRVKTPEGLRIII